MPDIETNGPITELRLSDGEVEHVLAGLRALKNSYLVGGSTFRVQYDELTALVSKIESCWK